MDYGRYEQACESRNSLGEKANRMSHDTRRATFFDFGLASQSAHGRAATLQDVSRFDSTSLNALMAMAWSSIITIDGN